MKFGKIVVLFFLIVFMLSGCNQKDKCLDSKNENENQNKKDVTIIRDEKIVNVPNNKLIKDVIIVEDKIGLGNNFYKKNLLKNKIELEIYDALISGLNNRKNKVSIPVTSDASRVSDIYEFVRLDNPQLFYIPTKFKILTSTLNNSITNIEIEFEYSDLWGPDNIKESKTHIQKSLEPLISKLSSINGDYNKILYLYNYLSKNIVYQNDSELCYSIYGALVKKHATCEGFSEAFSYVLNSLNIENIIVVGESKNQGHQWNMVKIDGFWYYFDVTWDAPINTSEYLPYNYFALTTADISKNHVIYYKDYLPLANNNKYNYYYNNDLVLYEYNEEAILNICVRSYSLNNKHLTFKVEDTKMFKLLLNDISKWGPKAFKRIGISKSEISYMINEELNIIDIVLEEES